MEKQYKLKYELLVAGLYPFKEEYSLNGYILKKKIIDESKIENYINDSLIFLSPLIRFCSYNIEKKSVYLTFEKEEIINLDIEDNEPKDKIAEKLYSLNILKGPDDLEKYLTLNVNNSIMFPIKVIRLFDMNDNLITYSFNFSKLNVPSLISHDINKTQEKIDRQNFRLNSGFSYTSLIELKNNNSFFDRALSLYYSSFSVNDEKVGFILLISSLETLLNLSTYAKVESCKECSQKMYKISETVAANVSKILMDKKLSIKNLIKKYYTKRSNYLHGSKVEISNSDEQELQEYVRKVLLMYWYISTCKKTFNHKEITNEFQSKIYNTKFEYCSFLTSLKNTSFKEKQNEILSQFFNSLISQTIQNKQ